MNKLPTESFCAEIKVLLYRTTFLFVICNDFNKEKYLDDTLEGGYASCDAICFTESAGEPVQIWVQEYVLGSSDLHEILAHEIVHAVNILFDKKGIKHDLHNDEPQAYLTGYLTGLIYRAIDEFKK